MKRISIVTPCYNEAGNLVPLYQRIKKIRDQFSEYEFEHIVIDNASTDTTPQFLQQLAVADKNFKVIINNRNYGHIRSPFHGLLQAKGDAVIMLASDLQDPPELINEFIKRWERGFKIVVGVKPRSKERLIMTLLRKTYYHLLSRFSETPIIKNFTGFGLYDRQVIKDLLIYQDNYPYFRGLISELGYAISEIEFEQPRRLEGKTKNNFYTLFDMAMLGVTTHSQFPLRCVSLIGSVSLLCSIALFFWFIWQGSLSLIFMNALFFLISLQFLFIGLLGEYVLAIHRQVFKRPLVIEKKRINFETDP